MKDQHKLIGGYRDLTQEEIDLINEIKQKEAEVLDLAMRVGHRVILQWQSSPDEAARADNSDADFWVGDACSTLQKGFMFLVRAVAQPQPIQSGVTKAPN